MLHFFRVLYYDIISRCDGANEFWSFHEWYTNMFYDGAVWYHYKYGNFTKCGWCGKRPYPHLYRFTWFYQFKEHEVLHWVSYRWAMGRFFYKFKIFFIMKRYYPIHIFWVKLDHYYLLPFKFGKPRAMKWYFMSKWLDHYNHYLGLLFLNTFSKQYLNGEHIVFYLVNINKYCKWFILLLISIFYYTIIIKVYIYFILLFFRVRQRIAFSKRIRREWSIFESKWYSDWILLRPFRDRRMQAILQYSNFVVFMMLTYDKYHKDREHIQFKRGMSGFLSGFYGFAITGFLMTLALRLFYILVYFIAIYFIRVAFRYIFKFLNIYFMWFIYILWFLYVLFRLKCRILFTDSLFKILWFLVMKLNNKFLVWLYIGWNYALVRSFVFWYPYSPHYFEPSTFFEYPLLYHPYIISFFNKIKSLSISSFNLPIISYLYYLIFARIFVLLFKLNSILKNSILIQFNFFLKYYSYIYTNFIILFSVNNYFSVKKYIFYIFLLFLIKSFFLTFIILFIFYMMFSILTSNLKIYSINLINYFFISLGLVNYLFFRLLKTMLRFILMSILFVLFRINTFYCCHFYVL